MDKVKEEDFSTQVEGALTQFGWRWVHQRPAKTDKGWRTALSGHKGFPDYVAVHERKKRLLFIELKGDGGKLSPEQTEWLNDLRKCVKVITVDIGSFEVYIWYPKDSDTMIETLR